MSSCSPEVGSSKVGPRRASAGFRLMYTLTEAGLASGSDRYPSVTGGAFSWTQRVNGGE